MKIDQVVTPRDEDVDDRVGELIREHAVGVTREDAVEIAHVERRVAGQRLERVGVRDRKDDELAGERITVELADEATERLDSQRLVAVNPGDETEGRSVAGAAADRVHDELELVPVRDRQHRKARDLVLGLRRYNLGHVDLLVVGSYAFLQRSRRAAP